MPSRRKVVALGALAATGLASSSIHFARNGSADTNQTRASPTSTGVGETQSASDVEDGPAADPDVVDVREYGATGDGVTDDSSAIEAAIRDAQPGQTVFLPETTDSYLLSFEGRDQEAAIDIGNDTELNDITILGEAPGAGAQTLQVEPGSYDTSTKNAAIRIHGRGTIEGLAFRNLTVDGGRPEDDSAAGLGGEAAMTGVHLNSDDGRGGHDILFRDCLVQNCSASAFRFEESGVTCRYVTARRAGRHGFNPVASDTVADPGFFGLSIKAVDCGGTGIDHRRGTARLQHVYTENNRSGNKWKHLVERLEVRNHHSVNDRNSGWRSNHSDPADDADAPPEQEIVFEDVFIENPTSGAIRVSGTDTTVKYDFRGVEVRSASVDASGGAVKVLRDAEPLTPGDGQLVVVGTENGYGLSVLVGGQLDLDTYLHHGNSRGPLEAQNIGVNIGDQREVDPGRNVFETPDRNRIGAFNRLSGTR